MSEDDRNIYYYTYLTEYGPISLIPRGGGKYAVVFNHEDLGTYSSLEHAFTAAITGQAKIKSSEFNLAEMDIPGDIESWQRKIFVSISRLRPG